MRGLLIDYFTIKFSNLFDSKYYLEQYRDARLSDMDPLWHFVKFGWKQGKNPSRFMDTSFYLKANPDVMQSGLNPAYHYVRYGKNEGRQPCAALNESPNPSEFEKGPKFQQDTSTGRASDDRNIPAAEVLFNSANADTWLDEEVLAQISDFSR